MRCLGRFALGAMCAWMLVAPGSLTAGERLRVASPSEPTAEAPSRVLIPWLEVRGRAGAEMGEHHDFVLAIDASESTLVDSGHDLDGDGRFPTGRTSEAAIRRLGPESGGSFPHRLKAIDLEDSILMAEVEAAEALIDRLDLENMRVGIVLFSDVARVLLGMTSDRAELMGACERIRREFPGMLGGTNIAAALAQSAELLEDSSVPRSIVFLSDGQPTRPLPPYAAYELAVSKAFLAGEAGIRIYPFALGPEAFREWDVYAEMASYTGGRVERLVVPADVVERLGALDLAGVESVTITNLTTGKPAVAVQTFANGAFEGFLELSVGDNRIRIDAVLTDGESVRIERSVSRLDPASFAEAQAALARDQLAEMLARLRVRSLKLELRAEILRKRRKRVEIDAAVQEHDATDRPAPAREGRVTGPGPIRYAPGAEAAE